MGNSLTTAGVMPVMRVTRLRVAAAVLATAVLGSCDVRAPGVDEPGPARGVAAPVEGPGGVSAAHAWRLVGVAAGERTVILAVEHGSCERVDGPRAIESAAAVEVTVGIVRDVPEDHVCNDVLATTTLAADLEVPLGERTLTGCGRASCTTAQPEDSLYLGPQAVADVVGDTIVAAVEDGEVTAHEADTGVVRWTRDDADLDVRVAGAASATAPDGTLLALLLGGGSQTVALDLATGEERWRIVENPVTTPSVAGEVLVYAVEDGTVRAYDTATGAPRWEVRLPGDPPQAVVAEGDAVVVLHGQGQVLGPGDDPDAFTTVGAAEVTALDLATGAVRWRAATAGGPQQLVVAGTSSSCTWSAGCTASSWAAGRSVGGRCPCTRTAGSCRRVARRSPSAPAAAENCVGWTSARVRGPISRGPRAGTAVRPRSGTCASRRTGWRSRPPGRTAAGASARRCGPSRAWQAATRTWSSCRRPWG